MGIALRQKRTAQKREPPVTYRGATSDPVFGYLIAIALTIGLIPLIPANTDLRYAIVWMVMAGFGRPVMAVRQQRAYLEQRHRKI